MIKLTELETAAIDDLVRSIRSNLKALSSGDEEKLFTLRRKVFQRLRADEIAKGVNRTKLRALKMKSQKSICPACKQEMKPTDELDLDRKIPWLYYVEDNVELLHRKCHRERHAKTKFAAAH